MPSTSSHELPLLVPAEIQHGLLALAQQRGISPQDLCLDILRQTLIAEGLLPHVAADQASAEADLYATTAAHAEDLRAKGGWTADVINEVFAHLQENEADLHGRAISGGNRDRVHRNLGKLIRRTLGARVMFVAGHRARVTTPATATSLIGSWTRLVPPILAAAAFSSPAGETHAAA